MMVDSRCWWGLACSLGLVAALSGCGDPSAQAPPSGSSSAPAAASSSPAPAPSYTGVCTQVGSSEAVNVHLTGVLEPDAGQAAQITVSTSGGASEVTTTMPTVGVPGTANAILETDLNGQPVSVSVLVRDNGGQLVYTGEGTATPQLFQPNGARCDGENYVLALVATPDGRLVPYPGEGTAGTLSEQPHFLYTHCGVDELRLGGAWYQRVGGPLDDGGGNPPEGWDNPYQQGSITRTGTTVVFTDDAGQRETFELRAGATEPKRLCE